MPRSGGIGRTGGKHRRLANPGPCSRSGCKKNTSRVVSEQSSEPPAELSALVQSLLDATPLHPVLLSIDAQPATLYANVMARHCFVAFAGVMPQKLVCASQGRLSLTKGKPGGIYRLHV